MKSEFQIVQCLQCQRVKSETGEWRESAKQLGDMEISHTYCPDCIGVLQDRLMASRDFVKWNFERQVEYLKNDLRSQDKKFDRNSLKSYLEEFYTLDGVDYEKLCEALSGELAAAVCPRCHREVDESEKHELFGPHVLHPRCHKEIQSKIKIILDNNWDKSEKFSAYLDLLKVEKSLRPSIREYLSDQEDKTLKV